MPPRFSRLRLRRRQPIRIDCIRSSTNSFLFRGPKRGGGMEKITPMRDIYCSVIFASFVHFFALSESFLPPFQRNQVSFSYFSPLHTFCSFHGSVLFAVCPPC